MTDFRALCAELVDAIDSGIPTQRMHLSPLMLRARAALSQPEPEGPTLAEIDDLCAKHSFHYEDNDSLECLLLIITDALARWGTPNLAETRRSLGGAPQPADGEVAELVASLERLSIEADAAMQLSDSEVLGRAAELLERLSPPQPAEGEVAELVNSLNMYGRHSGANDCHRAAELLKRLVRYEQSLSAVMPSDFKDWHENSRDEWPDVAAGVITSLRKREQLAWEQLERLSPPQPIPVFPEGTQVSEPSPTFTGRLLVPVAQPISVSERLPGPGDCDAEGRCWWFDDDDNKWCLEDPFEGPGILCCLRYPYWLPAHALPVPSHD